jgi:hypothetical protein
MRFMKSRFTSKHSSTLRSGFLFRLALVIAVFSNPVATPVFAQGRVQVSIDQNGLLLNGGQSAQVTVTVKCSPGNAEIIEAFVYITQEGIQSNFAPIPVVCRGGSNMYQITISTSGGETLKTGLAHASAYILISHPKTGRTTSGQASGSIILQ